ncbi:MAG: isoprenylcysteine carboxylmethyltransferase family protein [Chloroflexi bacterium]|nr:isoprenylcysteine carboxylmethyltransferase family protein [Chloroflexota bacterium]
MLMFAFSFLAPRKKREWRSMGLLTGFLVALFTEMFGFPLTVYILTSVLGNRYPVNNPLSHGNGHLWATFLGDWSTLFCNIGNILMLAGVVIMAIGWRKVHGARGELVTDGIYRLVRHPQYVGLILGILGMLLQWPTIITLVMAPVLIGAYVWLAGKEERDMEQQFGEAYRAYRQTTRGFWPTFVKKTAQQAGSHP